MAKDKVNDPKSCYGCRRLSVLDVLLLGFAVIPNPEVAMEGGKKNSLVQDQQSKKQLERNHERYKPLTEKFLLWLKNTANAYGWEAPPKEAKHMSAAELQSWAKWSPDEEPPMIPGTPENATANITGRISALKFHGVTAPDDIRDALRDCISMRKTNNKIYSELPNQSKKLAKDNENHKWFIDVLEQALTDLDPDDLLTRRMQRKRTDVANLAYEALKEMQEMTETVVDSWTRYVQKELGMVQVTLITYAAVQRARILDINFRTKINQDKELKEIVDGCKNHHYKLLDFPSTEYPDLLRDVRSVIWNEGPPRATSGPEILEKSMDIIHFPTTHVLVNFRALSAFWDSKYDGYPVPGYHVDFEHVHLQNTQKPHEDQQKSEKVKGKETRMAKKRKLEHDEEEGRKRLRVTYEEQVVLTWKLLNEMKLHFGWKAENLDDFENLELVKTADQAGMGDNFPADVFSEALGFVLDPSHDLSMSDSFSVQLLAKISHLFEGVDHDSVLPFEKLYLECDELKDARSLRRDNWDESESRSRIYQDGMCSDYHTILKYVATSMLPDFYQGDAVIWKIGNACREEYEIVKTPQCEVIEIPLDLGHHKLDPFRIGKEGKHINGKVDWYDKDRIFYTSNQPLHSGSILLKRRLVDYHADIRFANHDFSIFVFTHLLEAFRVLFPKAQDAEHDRMFLEQQHPDWFPLHMQRPENATDFLEMVENRVRQVQKQTVVGAQSSDYPHLRQLYDSLAKSDPQKLGETFGTETDKKVISTFDYDFTEESKIKPHPAVKTLWDIFILGQPDASVAVFGKQLRCYMDEWQYREDHLKSLKKKDRDRAVERLKAVLNQSQATDPLSWESLVQILKEDVPKLPCMERDRYFQSLAGEYRLHLEDIADAIDFKRDDILDKDDRAFNCRLLFKILRDWKTKEDTRDPEDKKQDWKKKTDLAKVRVVLAKKNEREKKREETQSKERGEMLKFGV